MDNNEFISVIITTYNRSKYIEKTLYSIENQTYNNLEVIVIDDGSSDIFANEIKKICSKFSKSQYHWKPNTGQPDSRNYGIRLAKGALFAFCDDDDYWVLDKLETQLKILEEKPDYDIVTGDIGFVDEEGNILKKIKSHKGYNHGYIFENLLPANRTSSVTPLLRKKVFEKTGLFNPKFTIAEDWDFWRRASYYHKFYSTNTVLAYVRLHDSNMSYKTETLFNRVMLYRKLSDELLKWGRGKFNKKEIQKIKKIEKQKYHKLISNNLNSKYKQIRFLLNLTLKEPKHGFYIISLFLFKY